MCMQVPTYLLCVLSLREAFRCLIGLPGKICDRRSEHWTGFCAHSCPTLFQMSSMRHGPTKPSRNPLPKLAHGAEEPRAGIRALDCGEDAAPGVIRRAAPALPPEASEPRSTLGEQRQAV